MVPDTASERLNLRKADWDEFGTALFGLKAELEQLPKESSFAPEVNGYPHACEATGGVAKIIAVSHSPHESGPCPKLKGLHLVER